jgi:hypothetical protein
MFVTDPLPTDAWAVRGNPRDQGRDTFPHVRWWRRRICAVTGLTSEGDFLERFKKGWYLNDLVLTPVDHLMGLCVAVSGGRSE